MIFSTRWFRALLLVPSMAAAQGASARLAERPFGTLREQAAMQQQWLQKRLDTFLPALMRKHGVDLWVV
ncbi:MAG: Xaa-Pro aminopeptidase, partial [Betaproteobacteria bacterium]|nr:Xaa-Pro aminopeptidase [Betaproteobacteria bacterium]